MSESKNPFVSPEEEPGAARLDAVHITEAERIRNAHLNHEASVQSIGILYYLSGSLLALTSIAMLAFVPSERLEAAPGGVAFSFLSLALAFLCFVLGRGLTILHPYVRIPVIIFAALGLLAFPCGTVINAYVLYLVLSAKGAVVLSAEYKGIIRRTPHIKYRSAFLVVMLITIVVAILAVILFAVSVF